MEFTSVREYDTHMISADSAHTYPKAHYMQVISIIMPSGLLRQTTEESSIDVLSWFIYVRLYVQGEVGRGNESYKRRKEDSRCSLGQANRREALVPRIGADANTLLYRAAPPSIKRRKRNPRPISSDYVFAQ